jgi:hypothetical protein
MHCFEDEDEENSKLGIAEFIFLGTGNPGNLGKMRSRKVEPKSTRGRALFLDNIVLQKSLSI